MRIVEGTTDRVVIDAEEAFGWIKTIAGQEKTKLHGRDRVGWPSPSLPPPQSGALAQAAGAADMTAPAGCQLIGRWRIVEACGIAAI